MNRPRLGRNVVALAVVSLLTDVSSEMIYPLLPVFLTATLGASATMLGAIEGMAESTAAVLKLASGWWSDRVKRRKPLIVAGYGLASAMRPLIAMAQSTSQVLAIRVTDRIGKGIRGSPRDALIADSVDEANRGRAFGFHRAMDHAGAFAGPLIAFVLLSWVGMDLRSVFWWAAVPGALSVLVLLAFVREPAAPADVLGRAGDADSSHTAIRQMPRSFWAYLGVVFVFTLGGSTDAFLLLRANELGVPIAMLGILWAAFHAVKSLLSTPGGALSDRFGRIPVMTAGWVVYTLVYFGFAMASTQWHAWALFLGYGVFYALTEGVERALVADIVPAAARGTAFGWFHLTIGLGALPASLVFGLIWDRAGSSTAFLFGGSVALAASIGLLAFAAMLRKR
ncbi:MAG: MFS transporter [Gemmatimonadota bacterium]